MTLYVLRRLAGSAVVLLVVSMVVFALLYLPPGQSLADLLPAWRARARAEVTADGARHLLLRQVASEEMLEVLRSQGPAGAHARFESLLLAARGTPPSGRSVQ